MNTKIQIFYLVPKRRGYAILQALTLLVCLGLALFPRQKLPPQKMQSPASSRFSTTATAGLSQTWGNPQAGSSTEEAAPLLVLEEEPQDRIERLLREAAFYYRKTSYASANARAKEILQIDPDNREARELLIASQASMKDEKQDDALLQQATLYFTQSQFDGAVMLLNRYVEKHPEEKDSLLPQIRKCYYNLGVLALREGKCDTAAEYFQQNLILAPQETLSIQALSVAQKCGRSDSNEGFNLNLL